MGRFDGFPEEGVLKYLMRIVAPAILFLLYVTSGLIGLKMGAVGGFATPVWYPSGFALGFLLLFGRKCIPAIAASAFTVNWLNGAAPSLALMISVGNTLEAVTAAFLLRRHRSFNASLSDPRDVILLLLYGAVLSPVVSAFGGTLSLWLHHVIVSGELHTVFRTWWFGDMMGILLATPLLLSWSSPPSHRTRKRITGELLLLFAVMGVMLLLIFSPFPEALPAQLRRPYLLFALLVWVTIPLEVHGVSLAIFLMSVLSLWATWKGYGPFVASNPVMAGIDVQLFFGVVGVTSLIVASVVRQRRLANEKLRQKAAEEKQQDERLRLVVEASPTAMIMVNSKGLITMVNRQVENLFGYPRSELLGYPIEKLIPHRFRWEHPRERQEFAAAPSARPMGKGRDLFGLRKDGKEIPVEIGLNPIETAEGLLILASVVDITARKETEEGLRERGHELEHLSRAKSDFITMVTHELRSPLSAIQEGIDLVFEEIEGPINPEQKETLGVVRRNIERLGRMVNNVLDLQQMELGRGKMNFSRNDLRPILREAAETIRLEVEKKGLRLSVEMPGEPTEASCDPDRIIQVFLNLGTNAVKFTDRGGSIAFRLKASPSEIRVEVEDSGVGIAAGDRGKIFEMFSQVGLTEARRPGGFGVGLAVCKQIVEGHGGRIWVEGKEGEGSLFVVSVPLNAGGPGKGSV